MHAAIADSEGRRDRCAFDKCRTDALDGAKLRCACQIGPIGRSDQHPAARTLPFVAFHAAEHCPEFLEDSDRKEFPKEMTRKSLVNVGRICFGGSSHRKSGHPAPRLPHQRLVKLTFVGASMSVSAVASCSLGIQGAN